MDPPDRSGRRSSSAADRQQRGHVRRHSGQPGVGDRRQKSDLLWRFKRPIPEDILLLHQTSRGVGLLGDKVYFAAADAVLVALDAKTGKELWNAKVEDYTHGYYMSSAPLVADGKVMVGVPGGELGVRGFVAAFDAETGTPAWKTYAVPALANRAAKLGPKAINGKPAGRRCGSPGLTIQQQI
jgi:alcohol dehydrogenase (cytochrome c)